MVDMALEINKSRCVSCGGCISTCPEQALTLENLSIEIDKNKCIECSICARFCPAGAISLLKN